MKANQLPAQQEGCKCQSEMSPPVQFSNSRESVAKLASSQTPAISLYPQSDAREPDGGPRGEGGEQ